ncbi:MAG: hypothetical protein NC489_38875 [Ruminococcus flavefaciens]|nr:hypothetical protein [Ruminococcus flavefaciens]
MKLNDEQLHFINDHKPNLLSKIKISSKNKYDPPIDIKPENTVNLVYVCPSCGNIFRCEIGVDIKVKFHPYHNDRSFDVMIPYMEPVIDCSCDSHSRMFQCDGNIAEVISCIIRKGYRTRDSCEGHVVRDKGEIRCSYLTFIDNDDYDLYHKLKELLNSDLSEFKDKIDIKVLNFFVPDNEDAYPVPFDDPEMNKADSRCISIEYSLVGIYVNFEEYENYEDITDEVFFDLKKSFIDFLWKLNEYLPDSKEVLGF